MKCKNLLLRTKKGIKYLYCKTKKTQISFNDCANCSLKEYKCTINQKNCAKNDFPFKRKTIKGKKHKLTKATEIPMKVKKIVWERDNHKCIYCNKYVDVYYANSHFIKRGQLGKGIEENVVTACPNCHYLYDFGTNSQEMINYTRKYLKSKYSDWNEEKLVYKK